ncbi:BQ2448_2713 [Microbotryum intermedium]|uniref:BQ2448_2713 protein n=1 Tax=Microbotryum intermedium TaxID=269621 RepID=A0A238FD65_9BASI|nr:BQ2448_2713 [Microbotryum intermedium]
MSLGTSASGGLPDASLLIQDLLSPPWTVLSSSTPQLITLHLSTLSLLDPATSALIPTIISCIASSPSLWRGQATASSSASSSATWRRLNWTRANEVYTSLVQGCLYRASEITKEHGTGWKARRTYAQFVDLYLQGVQDDEVGELAQSKPTTTTRVHPVVRLLITSALLVALQSIKQRQDKLYVGGRALMGRAHDQVLAAWDEYFREEEQDARLGATAMEWNGTTRTDQVSNDLPSWFAAQTFPMFPVDLLAVGPVSSLLNLLTKSWSDCFAGGTLFKSLPCDLIQTPQGLSWTVPSASHDQLSTLTQAPLFQALGPLSRAISRLVQAAALAARTTASTIPASSSPLVSVISLGSTLERVVNRVQKGWASTPWSDLEDDQALAPDTRERKEPWTLLKSLLFALTLIDSSLLIIVEPKPEVLPTRLQLDLAAQAVRVLHRSYFITLRFGSDGFSAWRGVWAGLMEVVGQDTRVQVEDLMRHMEPNRLGHAHERLVERSEATFYLNAAEVLIKRIGDDYLEDKVLPCCYPYLEDAKYRDTFESAHSVLLAVFATQKKVSSDLAIWYTKVLLQVSLAKALSWVLFALLPFQGLPEPYVGCPTATRLHDDQLLSSIRSIPLSTPTQASNPITTTTTSSPPATHDLSPTTSPSANVPPSSSSAALRTFEDDLTSTRLDETFSLSPVEVKALSLPRGHLLLTLIDQTTSVNLVLLRQVLDEIWELIREEPKDESGVVEDVEGFKEKGKGRGNEKKGESFVGTGRQALIKVLFATLGEGLDATKREEGVRYWLERREQLQ